MNKSSVTGLALIALIMGGLAGCHATNSSGEGVEEAEKADEAQKKIVTSAFLYPSKGVITIDSLPEKFRPEVQAWLDAEDKVPFKEAFSEELIVYLESLPDDLGSIRNPAAFEGTLAEMDFAKYFYLPDPSLALVDTPLKSPDGPVSIDSLKGGYTLLAFWASWCAPCLLELPHLAELEAEFGDDGLRLIAVQSEKPDADLATKTKQAIAKTGVENLTHWRDGGPENLAQFKATGQTLPMTVLIGPDGKEIGRQTGVVRALDAAEDATQWSTPEAHDFFAALVGN